MKGGTKSMVLMAYYSWMRDGKCLQRVLRLKAKVKKFSYPRWILKITRVQSQNFTLGLSCLLHRITDACYCPPKG